MFMLESWKHFFLLVNSDTLFMFDIVHAAVNNMSVCQFCSRCILLVNDINLNHVRKK